MKLTGKAIDLLSVCLARTHPDDLEIVRRFRNEQAAASAAPVGGSTPTSQAAGMLKSITIDPTIWDKWIKYAATKTSPPAALAAYGNLLLVADRGAEAEKNFREMYQLATNQADLTAAIEGIARSLRAEDGNLSRANAWLASLQKASAATPSTGSGQAASTGSGQAASTGSGQAASTGSPRGKP
jgi:hypothetical protein